MDDSDWESHGNLRQNPFVLESLNEKLCVQTLCLTSMVSSDDDPIHASIDAVIMDDYESVLMKPASLQQAFRILDCQRLSRLRGVDKGLEAIITLQLQHVKVHTDSTIVYNQVTKRRRIGSCELKVAHSQVVDYVHNLTHFHVDLIP